MIVSISGPAERDLRDILSFIARDNPMRAVSFVEELRTRCLSISAAPHRYPVVRRLAPGDVRQRRHGRYRIFYWVQAERIEILRILHEARDSDAMTFIE